MRNDDWFKGGGKGNSAGGSRDVALPFDRIPVPDVVEEDSEACWAMWEELIERESTEKPVVTRKPREPGTTMWDSTAPAGLREQDALLEPVPLDQLTVGTVLALSKKNNRVCPVASQWLMLHDILTLGGRRNLKPAAPEPVTGRAFAGTSSMNKRIRMRDQILWAADYGGLAAIYEFLLLLPEEDWCHVGE